MKPSLTLSFLALAVSCSSARIHAQTLFLTDGGAEVLEYSTNGVQSTFTSSLSGSYGLAFDSRGNLYVSDYNAGYVFKSGYQN